MTLFGVFCGFVFVFGTVFYIICTKKDVRNELLMSMVFYGTLIAICGFLLDGLF